MGPEYLFGGSYFCYVCEGIYPIVFQGFFTFSKFDSCVLTVAEFINYHAPQIWTHAYEKNN